MVVKTAFFMPKKHMHWEKFSDKTFSLSFLDYEAYFRKLPLKYLMHGCQNYSLRVQRSTLRRVPDYARKFLNFHWYIYIRQGCQNYSSRVQRSTLRKVNFFQNSKQRKIFQNCFRTLSDNRPDLWRKFSTALPKLHSSCPKNFSIFLQ